MAAVRAFVAWAVPEAAIGALAAAQSALRRSVEAANGIASWEPPARFHATVHFLGDVEETRLDALAAALARASAGHRGFDVALDGFGAFPPRGAPRVLFAGAGAGAEAFVALAADVRAALVAAGARSEEKRFHPHVTLARVKKPPRRVWRAPAFPAGIACAVGELTLYRSVLGPGGAKHTVVATAPLAAR